MTFTLKRRIGEPRHIPDGQRPGTYQRLAQNKPTAA